MSDIVIFIIKHSQSLLYGDVVVGLENAKFRVQPAARATPGGKIGELL